jgi:hypothetical protein
MNRIFSLLLLIAAAQQITADEDLQDVPTWREMDQQKTEANNYCAQQCPLIKRLWNKDCYAECQTNAFVRQRKYLERKIIARCQGEQFTEKFDLATTTAHGEHDMSVTITSYDNLEDFAAALSDSNVKKKTGIFHKNADKVKVEYFDQRLITDPGLRECVMPKVDLVTSRYKYLLERDLRNVRENN